MTTTDQRPAPDGDLDAAIRRAVRELRASAPPPLSLDDVATRPASAPYAWPGTGATAMRVLAVAAAVVVLVGGLWVVRRTDANRRATSSPAPTSTAPSGPASAPAVSPEDLVRQGLADAWRGLVAPRLPAGVQPITTDAVDHQVTLYATDDDSRLLQVWVASDAEFLAKSKDAPVRSVPAGDVFDTGTADAPGRWVHTHAGQVIGVETCALDVLSIAPAGGPQACDRPPGGLDGPAVEALAVGLADALAEHPVDTAAAAPSDRDQADTGPLVAAAGAIKGGRVSVAPGTAMWMASARAYGTTLTLVPNDGGAGDTVTVDIRVFRRTATTFPTGDRDVATVLVGHPAPDAVAVQLGSGGSSFVVVRAVAKGGVIARNWLTTADLDLKPYTGGIANAIDRLDAAAAGRAPGSLLDAGATPIPASYGPAAAHWLATVRALLPSGFHPVLAWSWHTFSSSVYVEAVADDGRWLSVAATIGGGSEARREIDGVGDPTAWQAVPEGNLQRYDMRADLVTPAGDHVQATCMRGQSDCGPDAPGADALAALVQSAGRSMDREQVRVTDADAAADPMPMVTCSQLASAPSLRALRQGGDTLGPRRRLLCSWDGPSGSTISVDVVLRAAPGGTALGIRRAALVGGVAVTGQGSGPDAYVVVNATVANGAPIGSDVAAALTPLVEQITVDLVGESGPIAAATHAASSASASDPSVPATAAPVLTAPPDPCASGDGSCVGGTTPTTAAQTMYTVVPGDYFVSIAKKLGVPLVVLLDANGLRPDSLLVPGQQLVVPPQLGQRPMAMVGRDGGLPQRLADEVFLPRLPKGFAIRQASYGRDSNELMVFSAGADDDRRQVVVWAARLPDQPADSGATTKGASADQSPGDHRDPTSRSGARLSGTSGWTFEAATLDTDGGAPPLSDTELLALLHALDTATAGR